MSAWNKEQLEKGREIMSTIIDLYGACSEIEVALDCLFRKQGYRPVYADNALAKIRGAIGDGLFPARIHAENKPSVPMALLKACNRVRFDYDADTEIRELELSKIADGFGFQIEE